MAGTRDEFTNILANMGVDDHTKLGRLPKRARVAIMVEAYAERREYDEPLFDPVPIATHQKLVIPKSVRRRAALGIKPELTLRDFVNRTGIPEDRVLELLVPSCLNLSLDGVWDGQRATSIGTRLAIIEVDDRQRVLLDAETLKVGRWATCVRLERWLGGTETVGTPAELAVSADAVAAQTYQCWWTDTDLWGGEDKGLWAAAMTELALLEDGHEERAVFHYLLDDLQVSVRGANRILEALHERVALDRPSLRVRRDEVRPS